MTSGGFVDFQGVWRKNDDYYLDYAGVSRAPGEMFTDGAGIARHPGDWFTDSTGKTCGPGGSFVDARGNIQAPSITSASKPLDQVAKEKKKEEKPKEEPLYKKVRVNETHEEMMERLKKQAEEDLKAGKLDNIHQEVRYSKPLEEHKKNYFNNFFWDDFKQVIGNLFIYLISCFISLGICYLLTRIEYKELFDAHPYKLLYIPTIISFTITLIIVIIYNIKNYNNMSFKQMYFIMTPLSTILLEVFGWNTYITIEKIFLVFYGFGVSLIPCGVLFLVFFIKHIIDQPPYYYT